MNSDYKFIQRGNVQCILLICTNSAVIHKLMELTLEGVAALSNATHT